MSNLNFFKGCFASEMTSTVALFRACPDDRLDYRPHPVNRSAREVIEHLLAHTFDLKVILTNKTCDEMLTYTFNGSQDAADKLEVMWNEVKDLLENCSDVQWEQEQVELLVNGKSFVTLPRANMMWFFFFDMIHHRGQLSSYIRPMGGKNPAVYGYSFDTLNA